MQNGKPRSVLVTDEVSQKADFSDTTLDWQPRERASDRRFVRLDSRGPGVRFRRAGYDSEGQ